MEEIYIVTYKQTSFKVVVEDSINDMCKVMMYAEDDTPITDEFEKRFWEIWEDEPYYPKFEDEWQMVVRLIAELSEKPTVLAETQPEI